MQFRSSSPLASLIWMIVFGLVFLGASVGLYFSAQIPSSWIKETGKITSYTVDNGAGTNHGTTYCAIVAYNVKGVTYTATATSCGGTPTVGDPAQVAYNPSNPSQGKVVGGIGDIFIIGLTALVGLALIIFAPINYRRLNNAPPVQPGSVFTNQWPHVPNPVDQVDQAIATGQGQPVTPPTTPPVVPGSAPPAAPPAPPATATDQPAPPPDSNPPS